MTQRPLGNTGESVTMLCLGGYHFGHASEPEAEKIIETALEGGIRFFDCAVQYQNGGSEERYGKLLLSKHREQVYYMTKSQAKTAEKAQQELEDSLRRSQTDYIDLWQIHAIGSPEDVDERLDNGVLEVFLKAKEQGKVRHIGFTGHVTPNAHLRMLERTKDDNPFDTCQMPMNLVDPGYSSFIMNVMPKLVERNIGVLAMKTMSFGNFFGQRDATKIIPEKISVEEALNFVWSLPVSSIVSGNETAEQLQEKINALKTFKELSESDRMALIEKVAEFAGPDMETYKS